MSASLVGSEMCIRDSLRDGLAATSLAAAGPGVVDVAAAAAAHHAALLRLCLLYTSDAADDM
eukprot:4242690-Alexandrium_andersonii.AAC.1